jgi:phosphate transport system permease protein
VGLLWLVPHLIPVSQFLNTHLGWIPLFASSNQTYGKSMFADAVVLAVLVVAGVLGYTFSRGLHRFDLTFFTHSMHAVAEQDPNGGAYHAIVGTLEQVGIAAVIGTPLGILVAIYLVEYSTGRLGRAVSFLVDVMTGLPSIVAGLFIFALWVSHSTPGSDAR